MNRKFAGLPDSKARVWLCRKQLCRKGSGGHSRRQSGHKAGVCLHSKEAWKHPGPYWQEHSQPVPASSSGVQRPVWGSPVQVKCWHIGTSAVEGHHLGMAEGWRTWPMKKCWDSSAFSSWTREGSGNERAHFRLQLYN